MDWLYLMASKFVGVRFSQALRASLSIYVVFFATIAACIFLPDVVLWLPKHLFPESVGCFKNPSGAGSICPSAYWPPRQAPHPPLCLDPARIQTTRRPRRH